MELEITTFDFTDIYKEEFVPLINRLVNTCLQHEISLFISCCIKSTNSETYYENTLVNDPDSINLCLKDNTLQKHITVSRGYEVTPRNFQDDIDSAFLEYELGNESENKSVTCDTTPKTITIFDHSKVYSKEVASQIKNLENMSLKYEMPFFATCCTKSSECETTYQNTMANSPVSSQINLKVNTFPRHIGICRGFETTSRKTSESSNDALKQKLNIFCSEIS